MNRYSQNNSVVQPKREIKQSIYDIYYTIKPGDRLDQLADKYYGDKLGSVIIMWANPKYYNEWEIRVGETIRIPMPLERLTSIINLK